MLSNDPEQSMSEVYQEESTKLSIREEKLQKLAGRERQIYASSKSSSFYKQKSRDSVYASTASRDLTYKTTIRQPQRILSWSNLSKNDSGSGGGKNGNRLSAQSAIDIIDTVSRGKFHHSMQQLNHNASSSQNPPPPPGPAQLPPLKHASAAAHASHDACRSPKIRGITSTTPHNTAGEQTANITTSLNPPTYHSPQPQQPYNHMQTYSYGSLSMSNPESLELYGEAAGLQLKTSTTLRPIPEPAPSGASTRKATLARPTTPSKNVQAVAALTKSDPSTTPMPEQKPTLPVAKSKPCETPEPRPLEAKSPNPSPSPPKQGHAEPETKEPISSVAVSAKPIFSKPAVRRKRRLSRENSKKSQSSESSIESIESLDETKYPATAGQVYMYTKVHNDEDEADDPWPGTHDSSISTLTSRASAKYSRDFDTRTKTFYVHQGYLIHGPVHAALLDRIAHVVISEYPALRTRFFRNDRIIDADLECIVDHQKVYEKSYYANVHAGQLPYIHRSSCLDYKYREGEGHRNLCFYQEATLDATKNWCQESDPTKDTLALLIFPPHTPSRDSTLACSAVAFLFATGIADEQTCTWFSRTVLGLYQALMSMEVTETALMEQKARDLLAANDNDLEEFDFIDHAMCEQNSSTNHSDMLGFWRSILIESHQDVIHEPHKLEENITKLEKLAKSHQSRFNTTKKRLEDMRRMLNKNIEQRKKLDKYTSGNATDPFKSSNDDSIDDVSEESKAEILKVIANEEFGINDVPSLLEKHGIRISVMENLKVKDMTLEKFSELREEHLENVRLLSRERRKLLALSTYMRNRFRGCIEEQNRLKFNLEQKISRTKREIAKLKDSLEKCQNDLDLNDDTLIRYRTLLDPPVIQFALPEGNLQSSIHGSSMNLLNDSDVPSTDCLKIQRVKHHHAAFRFSIDATVTQKLRAFCKDWAVVKDPQGETFVTGQERSLSSHNLLAALDHEKIDGKVNLMECLLLSSFGILLRHIVGIEKFIIGREVSFRAAYMSDRLMVGPLSRPVPFRVDLADGAVTYHETFSNVALQMQSALDSLFCPLPLLRRHFNMDLLLRIRFQFISRAEVREWKARQLDLEDLSAMHQSIGLEIDPSVNGAAKSNTRLWSMDESDEYDIKFILVEDEDRIHGTIKYNEDLYTKKHVSRWAEKFTSIFDSIDSRNRRRSVTNIISHFYHTAFGKSMSSLDLEDGVN